MKNINKQKLTVIVAVLGLFLLTAGVTYAFFTYIGSGSTENTVSSDSITFLYEEKDAQGNGINIIDATPVSDEVGKAGPAFNFEISSKTANKISIPYEIAVRKKAGSDNLDDVVKLYLTKVDGTGNEEEVALGTFSSFTTKTYYGHEQKLLTEQKVPQSSSNYIQKYRLRMWIDEETDFSSGNYDNKTFSVTVNVYSEGKVVTPEDIANQNNAGVLQVLLDGNEIFPVETNGTHYEETLPAGTRNAELVIKPANKYSKVEIGKTDSTYTNLIAMNKKTGILPISVTPSMTTNAHIKLNDGDNYFKGVITAEDGVTTQTLTFKLTVPAGQAAGNLLTSLILADNTISPNTYYGTYEDGLYQSSVTNSGDPTYYFHQNNSVVSYAGHDWIVVRINEDGTTRLMLADKMDNTEYVVNNIDGSYAWSVLENEDYTGTQGNTNSSEWYNENHHTLVEYSYYSKGEGPSNLVYPYDNPKPLIKTALESWYQTNIASNNDYSKWIADKSGNYFCEAFHLKSGINDTTYWNSHEDDWMLTPVQELWEYESDLMDNGQIPSFTCNTDIFGHQYNNSDIGLLSDYEAINGGYSSSYTMWLSNAGGRDPYEKGILSFALFNYGVSTNLTRNGGYLRPVVNLKASTTATRDGNGGYIVD